MNRKRAWWIHPGKLTLYFVLPLYLFIVYLVPAMWPRLVVLKGANYLGPSFAGTGVAMITLLGLFGFLGSRIAVDRPAPGGYVVEPLRLAGVGTVTILAYAIWFFPILTHGSTSLERDELNRMPGVTSFTQLGVPFVLCYLHCRLTSGQTFPSFVRWQFRAVLGLTIARVFIWSERLAFIEVVLPALVLVLTYGKPRLRLSRALHSAIATWGPGLAAPCLIAAFTFTEYFRSWRFYSQTQSLSLFDFMTSRVVTYYFTALNNGAGMLATRSEEWPTYNFLFTANWFYSLPFGIGDYFYRVIIGYKDSPAESFLNSYADPEFNNMSGIFPIVYDLGTIGASLYFCALGLAAGMLYRSMIRGGKTGGLLYPSVFLGCLEVLRTPYLNSARIILLFVGALLLLTSMRINGAPIAVGIHGREMDAAVP
jgi:hypothetical protein